MRRRRWPALVGAVGLVVVTTAPSAASLADHGEVAAGPSAGAVTVEAPADLASAVLGQGSGSGLARARHAVGLAATRPSVPVAAAEPSEGPRARALRRAGWAVPEALDGGYHLVKIRTMEDAGAPSGLLQLVYARGEARLSVFQRPGGLEDDAMLAGAEPTRGEAAWHWPDADPPRCAWEARGAAYVAVGGASDRDLQRAVASFPAPDETSEGGADEHPLLRHLLRLLEGWVRLLGA